MSAGIKEPGLALVTTGVGKPGGTLTLTGRLGSAGQEGFSAHSPTCGGGHTAALGNVLHHLSPDAQPLSPVAPNGIYCSSSMGHVTILFRLHHLLFSGVGSRARKHPRSKDSAGSINQNRFLIYCRRLVLYSMF